MNDAQTIVLYALSTLAQTCAALAAFVGAVGLYRLQSLRARRAGILRDISAVLGHPTQTTEQLLARARTMVEDPYRPLPALLDDYDGAPSRIRRSAKALWGVRGTHTAARPPPAPHSFRYCGAIFWPYLPATYRLVPIVGANQIPLVNPLGRPLVALDGALWAGPGPRFNPLGPAGAATPTLTGVPGAT